MGRTLRLVNTKANFVNFRYFYDRIAFQIAKDYRKD